MKSIIITSTGRCGTTFLLLIYQYLGFKTGFDDRNMGSYIYKNCNSGLEKRKGDIGKFEVIKNPLFLGQMGELDTENISWVVVPIRNFEESAKSREYHNKKAGGLMGGAKNWGDQVKLYNGYMSKYIQDMVKNDIPTIFLDFKKMTNDEEYLYNKIKITFTKDISYDFFKECYKKASEHQSIRTPK
jgi:hypothetical protein